MKLKLPLAAFLLSTGLAASAQGTFVYDQQSTGTIDGGASLSQTPFGQSFTPTLDAVGFIELQLFDSAAATTIDVNIRSGSITGAILGTSLPTTMPGNSSGIFDFLFSNPVTLTPGTKYYFEPVMVGGGSSVGADITFVQYTGGDAIYGGTAFNNQDLWFREGVVTAVPEPASGALLVVAGLLFWRGRR
jgi:hypothetical protein